MMPLLAQPFLFLRHGQTASNEAGTIGGATDLPLTAQGHAQAQAAAEVLQEVEIASIWCSPLRRAQDTAAPVARRKNLPVRILPDLQERNWGVWEGHPRSVLVRDATPERGEGPDAFRDRIRRALNAITGPFPALIVAHSGTARELHALLSPAPFRRPTNGEVSRWECDNGVWVNRLLSPNGRTAGVEAREPSL
ncbi:histidine phosphatase family protein [Falsirhodobacter sp. 20TX0035]|uniref:histidine phosphatase family protein n=1 Tax=Falsirhodobacter sp. 20TX0035 TaxID=3022019 RepID=UPI00232F2ABA|nr:histidine phosphatase family protein [Falsirhodobacter sp. 20TX0035]MDB6454433.1 histidine phosphatase family protein [Falsirhodobacter sp. 20TX0035]